MGNYPCRWMNHKLANGMKMWKGYGNTTTLLFSLKRLEIVHQERRGQVKNIVTEHFNGTLFHKSGPGNKQHTNQPTMAYLAEAQVLCLSQVKEGPTDVFVVLHVIYYRAFSASPC